MGKRYDPLSLRALARLIVITKEGCSLLDPREQVRLRIPDYSRKITELFKKIKTDPRFYFLKHSSLWEFVQRKLHRCSSSNGATTWRIEELTDSERKQRIRVLLRTARKGFSSLAPKEKTQLRRKLRRLGHKGGIYGKT